MTAITKHITSLIFGSEPSEEEYPDPDEVTVTPEQATLLGVLRHADTPLHSQQRLQKYMFLIDEALDEKYSLYVWKSYDYGPYSKSLKQDVNTLARKGLLIEETRQTLGGNTRRYYHLTDAGSNVLDDVLGHGDDFTELMEYVEKIVTEHDDIPLSNLMWDVIDEYPEYNKTVYKPTR